MNDYACPVRVELYIHNCKTAGFLCPCTTINAWFLCEIYYIYSFWKIERPCLKWQGLSLDEMIIFRYLNKFFSEGNTDKPAVQKAARFYFWMDVCCFKAQGSLILLLNIHDPIHIFSVCLLSTSCSFFPVWAYSGTYVLVYSYFPPHTLSSCGSALH